MNFDGKLLRPLKVSSETEMLSGAPHNGVIRDALPVPPVYHGTVPDFWDYHAKTYWSMILDPTWTTPIEYAIWTETSGKLAFASAELKQFYGDIVDYGTIKINTTSNVFNILGFIYLKDGITPITVLTTLDMLDPTRKLLKVASNLLDPSKDSIAYLVGFEAPCRFNWSRNDKYRTRFYNNGKNWIPLKGYPPINLGPIGSNFNLVS